MRNNKCVPTNEKEVLDHIDGLSDQLDKERLSGLQEFKNSQLIKDEILQRESMRMAAKHGRTHPQVLEFESRAELNKQMYPGVEIEIEKASIRQEPFSQTSWRVHGRLFDKESKPLKSHNVFLSDASVRWIEAIGSSCTTETGYYSLTLDEKLFGRFENGQPMFLSVSDRSQKTIFMSKEPLFPKKGLITYRDIFLREEECSPPVKRNPDSDVPDGDGKDKPPITRNPDSENPDGNKKDKPPISRNPKSDGSDGKNKGKK